MAAPDKRHRTRWTREETAEFHRLWDRTKTANQNADAISKITGRTLHAVLWKAGREDLTGFDLRDPFAPDERMVSAHATKSNMAGGFGAVPLRAGRRVAPALPRECETEAPKRFRHLRVIEGGKAEALPRGVVRIDLRKPTPRHVRWARQQIACGMSLDEFAITFRLDADALAQALRIEGAA